MKRTVRRITKNKKSKIKNTQREKKRGRRTIKRSDGKAKGKDSMRMFIKHVTKNKNAIRFRYLQHICEDVGICLSLNYNVEKILDLFHYFNFDYLVNSPKLLSSQGQNGVIRLLHYQVTHDDLVYDGYGIIKKTLKEYGDNLAYEYAAGKYCINKLCRHFPIFGLTYGLYLNYFNGRDINFQSREAIDKESIAVIDRLEYANEPNTLNIMCNLHTSFCLVGQFYNNFMEIEDYLKKYAREANDLPFILFQTYCALHCCRDVFTHYDLHLGNVGIVELPNNNHIEYEYTFTDPSERTHLIRFKSKYIVKLLDYGKSFFSGTDEHSNPINSEIFIHMLKNSGFCKEAYKIGLIDMSFMNQVRSLNNHSFDLRFIKSLEDLERRVPIFTMYPTLKLLSTASVYDQYRGAAHTVGHPYNPDLSAPIYNVSDAYFKLGEYLLSNMDNVNGLNEANYAETVSLGTLQVYDSEREMVFQRSKMPGKTGRFTLDATNLI